MTRSTSMAKLAWTRLTNDAVESYADLGAKISRRICCASTSPNKLRRCSVRS